MTADPSSTPTPPPADAAAAPAVPLKFPVVGVGASAGAVAALTRLFEALPERPGMAFVVVVHLSPDHESSLPAIVQKHTRMKVERVTQTVRLRPDHVYVISPSQQLQMQDGHLTAHAVDERSAVPIAIDVLFRTLGDAHRERAIGIVMSGMGSDGSVGLRRIKECGGVSFAQAPADAEFDSMPASAIASGVVDFVLPAAELGPKLVEVWANARRIELPAPPDVSMQAEHPPTVAAEAAAVAALAEVMTLLRDRTKHDFRHYKAATVLRRIERRMQVTGTATLPEYSRHLQAHTDETPALLRDLLISVTNFFRDPEAFDALEPTLAGTLLAPTADVPKVRAWVAGCATGDEAYSVGMLLSELAGRHPMTPDVQVFASDIDERAIATARAGVYPASIAADVSAARIQQFFQREQAHLRVRKELRDRVLFVLHNLLRDPPFSNLDLVCCRNLLIYLDRPIQAQLLQVFHFALRPGGLLFLGNAESVELADGLFTVLDKKQRIYRAEPASRARRAIAATPPWSLHQAQASSPPAPARAAAAGTPAILHEQLRSRHLPASALLDAAYDILHSTGEIAKFMRFAPGAPSQNLLDVVRPELGAELHSALFKARQQSKSVEARHVKVRLQDREVWVAMTVRPLVIDAVEHVLVTFDDVEVTLAPTGRSRGRGRPDPALVLLEDELKQAREELRGSLGEAAITNEEMRAANEELQSINEELRSATEELETSKEEIQSVNEELITVNQELKAKVEEAGLVNDDLTNLIGATDIATIFVDRTMRIKRFTPHASQLFNLIASDVGRSLLHITHRLDYDHLEADAMEAFETLRVVEREIYGEGDTSYFVRVVPYRTRQDLIDGAVLTFFDMSDTRRAERLAASGEANLRLLVESTKDFAILTLDTAGLVTTWNEGAQRMFGFAPDEIVGQPVDTLFTPKDRAAGAPQAEMQSARETGRANDERWHLRKDGSSFFCSGIMTPMFEHGRLAGYAKIARDLTDSKRAEIQLGALLEKETEVRAELQRAAAMKDEFLAVMSHELKHPLNLIHVNAELLARLPEARSAPAVARAADVIRRAVLSQAKITDDLLDLSRLRTGKLAINLAAVLWAPVLSRVVDAVDEDARAKDLSISVSAGAEHVAVRADPVRVEQIVWNLVSNALKFTRPGGTIALELVRDGDQARLDVTDDGQGIAPDFLGEVFEMFRQADRSTTRAHGGMGIGLALVKHLAEEQGGRVAAHSDGLGRGARFSVWLPLVEAAPREAADGETMPALHGLDLLLVDDTADALESFAALLRLEGAQVTAVTSAQLALAAVEDARFHAILSDVAMPQMDGHELIRRLRADARTAQMPAIALTGFGRAEDAHRALSAGFDAHLAKPVQLAQLLVVIERLPGIKLPRAKGDDV